MISEIINERKEFSLITMLQRLILSELYSLG